jgi:hypothetical protein
MMCKVAHRLEFSGVQTAKGCATASVERKARHNKMSFCVSFEIPLKILNSVDSLLITGDEAGRGDSFDY